MNLIKLMIILGEIKMELVGKLKDEMAQAKDKDEAKEIMENAGMKLTDDELDTVAGGIWMRRPPKEWIESHRHPI